MTSPLENERKKIFVVDVLDNDDDGDLTMIDCSVAPTARPLLSICLGQD